jgi:putative ubiquitin-RnfH superfamily antitoxin RatB of RatAB toxin-antitoxin module
MADPPAIEVVYAPAERQRVVAVTLTGGLTAMQAVRASGLLEEFPELDATGLLLGVWGRPVREDQLLRAGDRVEIYRPLRFDPRAARRDAARASNPGTRRAKATRN